MTRELTIADNDVLEVRRCLDGMRQHRSIIATLLQPIEVDTRLPRDRVIHALKRMASVGEVGIEGDLNVLKGQPGKVFFRSIGDFPKIPPELPIEDFGTPISSEPTTP